MSPSACGCGDRTQLLVHDHPVVDRQTRLAGQFVPGRGPDAVDHEVGGERALAGDDLVDLPALALDPLDGRSGEDTDAVALVPLPQMFLELR